MRSCLKGQDSFICVRTCLNEEVVCSMFIYIVCCTVGELGSLLQLLLLPFARDLIVLYIYYFGRTAIYIMRQIKWLSCP